MIVYKGDIYKTTYEDSGIKANIVIDSGFFIGSRQMFNNSNIIYNWGINHGWFYIL